MISIQTSCGHRFKSVKAVLFDKDGTLIDSHYYWGNVIQTRARIMVQHLNLNTSAFAQLCNVMGFDIESQCLSPKGPIALVDRMSVINIVCKFISQNFHYVKVSEIDEIFNKSNSVLLPRLSEIIRPIESATSLLLKLIQIGIPVAIVTSDSASNTNIYLEKTGLSGHGLILVCRDTCPHPKETGYPAIQAADLLNIDISDTLVIGDAPMDFLMANNSGSKHLLVSTGQLDHQHLLNTTPNVIKSLGDVAIIS